MKDIQKLRKMYELKKVYRITSVAGRKESSAEHSWSCLILADYLLEKVEAKLDRLKVYELLIYHDVVEIESGDFPLNHTEQRKNKAATEMNAMKKLKKEFPDFIASKFDNLFTEFEEQKTPEARFAKAVDKLDATLNEFDYKEDWKGWTEEMLREFNTAAFKGFPELEKIFEQMLAYLRDNKYFH